ncbi:MAG: methylated-DNA--[protein]-cysteine S-methyltransferase [Chitinophagales bacterium]
MHIQNPTDIQKYYQALVERNEQYIGIFYVGVKTTGIFCIATCRARKPKLENVEFYTEVKELLQAGYRPCKICKPTQNADQAPEEVLKAVKMVANSPKEKITDYTLTQNGLSPEFLRRWFNKHYGMTFHAYQRMIRINLAFQEVKNGKTVTDSAFDTGYESLSGFGYTFKKVIGKSPQQSKGQNLIYISRLTTPIGPMFACATDEGLCLLEFVERKMLETEFRDLQHRLNATILAGENDHIRQVKWELTEYFAGTRQTFEVRLLTPGTAFQQSVWRELLKIPYGTTRSYQAQAEKLGKPKAVRAVANANGCNRIAIVIPCHRVIGKNGHLTGYAGGLERKKWLLEHEGRHGNQD